MFLRNDIHPSISFKNVSNRSGIIVLESPNDEIVTWKNTVKVFSPFDLDLLSLKPGEILYNSGDRSKIVPNTDRYIIQILSLK